METVTKYYHLLEERILSSLLSSGLRHRTKDCTGLWLGPLVGLSALLTFLKEDNSYSELCLLTGIAGGGLVISCLCLYARLMMDNDAAKDFHVIYFFPSITLSTLFLLVGNKGLLVSVSWGLMVGSLSTWGVIQMMSNLPGCFTLGEATAVTHGIVLFILSTFTNLPLRYHLPPIHDSDIATVIVQVGILYAMSISILCANFPKLRGPTSFYLLSIGMLGFLAIPALHILLDQSPLCWIFTFVFNSQAKIILFIYWAVCLLLAIIFGTYQTLKQTHASTSIRKIFHLLAVLVYIPGLICEPTLLYLASGMVLAFFSMIEVLRILNLPPFGDFLQQTFSAYVDDKDSLISLTPLYLMCGISAPLWLPTENMGLLKLMSGVLTIGIGDSAASFIGSNWGKHKWTGSDKSIEGTVACVVSQLITIFGLAFFGCFESPLLVRSIFSVILVSLVEAHTEQVDNLALPFLMYLCLTV
ncbi:dolichol kinase [Copidosoma floridanum]|uniref:dolichol kinase n=1 Tax=Copidosoma floridanum TaxID=29053 RepID=UPI0006C9D837|nr:dolichol kinase [Copidosoma floridanum]